jgi:hypothetical protein
MPILDALVKFMISLPGATGAAIVDIESGQTLVGAGAVDAEVLAVCGVANARFLRFKTELAEEKYHQQIEDVLITLTDDYHIIRLIRRPGHKARQFLYLILDRALGNLALTRLKLTAIEEELTQSDTDSRLMDIECDYLMDSDNIRSKIERIRDYSDNNMFAKSVRDEEIPAFMRTDVALKLLGVEISEDDSSFDAALHSPMTVTK